MSAFQFGNYYHYRGDSLSDLMSYRINALEAQIKEVGMSILEYVNYDEYSAWIDSLPEKGGADLLKTMQERLDTLVTEECTCSDPERTCPACRHAAYHKWYLQEGE